MELIPSNLFSGDDLQILLPRLWTLLGKQTERYTMGDSTSVTVEVAKELLASLWYTITLAMDENHTPYGRLLSDELMPFVKQGQTILQDKLEAAKRLWEMVCRTASEIQNFYFTDTLRGIDDYLRHYDLHYFAHRKPLCIDYPLLNAPSETMHGLTYTEQYLKCMLAENLLIHGFEKNAVICVLQTVAPDYQEHYLNLCEQSITNALGLAMIRKNVRTLHLGHEEQSEIQEMMQNRSCEKQREFLHVAARTICDQMDITDKWIMDYVTSFSDTLLPRIEAALERVDLSHIFMLSCKQVLSV